MFQLNADVCDSMARRTPNMPDLLGVACSVDDEVAPSNRLCKASARAVARKLISNVHANSES